MCILVGFCSESRNRRIASQLAKFTNKTTSPSEGNDFCRFDLTLEIYSQLNLGTKTETKGILGNDGTAEYIDRKRLEYWTKIWPGGLCRESHPSFEI